MHQLRQRLASEMKRCQNKRNFSHLIHGHTKGGRKTTTFRCWQGILERCYNKKKAGFKYYGERGIKVCKRWRKFANFLADMGEKPAGLTIERIDNNGDYAPENCKWATRKEQTRNTTRSRLINFNGKTQCLTDWEKELGFSKWAIGKRLSSGWRITRALETPHIKFLKIRRQEIAETAAKTRWAKG